MLRGRSWLVLAAALLLAGAELPPPGASSCSGCHGAVAPMPPLAGRPAPEIEAALAGFADGSREGTVMNRLARGLTPTQAAAIAVWWSGQGVGGGK